MSRGRGGAIRRSVWKWALAAAIVIAALAWLRTQWAGFDWRLVAGSFREIRWGWVAGSLVFIGASYLGRALRWTVFIKPLRPRPSLRNLLSATVIGFTAVTLLGRPGEVIRPYLIASKERVPVASQFAALALERIFDLLMAVSIFAFALAKVRSSGVRVGEQLSWVLAAGGRVAAAACVALILLLIGLRHFNAAFRKVLALVTGLLPRGWQPRIARLADGFLSGIESARSDAALAAMLGYSILEWALIAGCYWCTVRSFPATHSFTIVDILILMGFVSFGAVVQIPGIGGGMQVVTALVLVELFHVRLEVATSFALELWILAFVAIVPVGLVLALREGLSWRGLRQAGAEAAG